MADWIKMRSSLLTNPKVIRMARVLLADPEFMEWLHGDCHSVTQRDASVTKRDIPVVTRIVVGALLPTWSAVNDTAGRDGIIRHTASQDIDETAGVPGFGRALKAVEWLQDLPDGDGVRFVNFEEHNSPQKERSLTSKSGAERTKEYRERRKREAEESRHGDEKRDAHGDGAVTSQRDDREEKNRGEKNNPHTPTGADIRFERFWAAYPRKVAKDAARKAFDKRKPDSELLAKMLEAIRAQKQSDDWLKDGGQFVPHPATWLNQGRWQDDILAGAGGGGSSDWTAGAH